MPIPKLIHLCWFGHSSYPDLAKKCIQSWKNILPEYTIKLWNEDNFNINQNDFTRKAYQEKKWAFVSDYARLTALYEYGGVYMDTDLEVIRDFSNLLIGKKYVSSIVEGGLITCGFIACEAKHPFIQELIKYYRSQENNEIKLTMNPLVFTSIAKRLYCFPFGVDHFENEEIQILPLQYFMPFKKNMFGRDIYSRRKYAITTNTYTIHHDMGSWTNRNKLRHFLAKVVRLTTPEHVYLYLKRKKYERILKSSRIF